MGDSSELILLRKMIYIHHCVAFYAINAVCGVSLDFKDLQVFIAVAETLHFARAGKILHLSPSAVSRTVQRLEQELAAGLLERNNRSVQLTATGREFLVYAREACQSLEQFKEQVHRSTAQLSGELTVYGSVTAVYSILSPILDSYRLQFPAVDIKLHTGDQADAIDQVLNDQADIAITAKPDSLPARVVFQTLMFSPLVFIAPMRSCEVAHKVDQLLTPGTSMRWDAVPFIVSERGQARVELDQWFRQQSVTPDIYAQVAGHEAIVSMVALGFGIGVVPELVLLNSPLRDQVREVAVSPKLPAFDIGLCSLRSRLDRPVLQSFLNLALPLFA